MKKDSTTLWIRICLFNLVVVALYGTVMRYKIGFEFPHFNQKNLQHAHSHFAFGGWVSLLLMALLVHVVREHISPATKKLFTWLLILTLTSSYGMLISFTIEGYAFYSITSSFLYTLVSFAFCYYFYRTIRKIPHLAGKKWMNAAIAFNVLSSVATFYLGYMMASKNIGQHDYLASIYWYLHFQYNGWFFFACVGLFVHFLHSRQIYLNVEKTAFRLLAYSCIPAYGLSVLWLKIHDAVYLIIVLAAIAQFVGLILLVREMWARTGIRTHITDLTGRILLLCCSIAIVTKITLQLASVVPSVSHFAFGFRPVVIAYLHLVLLGFVTVFLLAAIHMQHFLRFSKLSAVGVFVFLVGILLNELGLAAQGIASFSYTLLPYVNELLLGAALMMLGGGLLMTGARRSQTGLTGNHHRPLSPA